MSREELKQILTDLQLHAEPEHSDDGFSTEVIEAMIENVLDGKLKMQYSMGVLSYSMTDEGKEFVEAMGTSQDTHEVRSKEPEQ